MTNIDPKLNVIHEYISRKRISILIKECKHFPIKESKAHLIVLNQSSAKVFGLFLGTFLLKVYNLLCIRKAQFLVAHQLALHLSLRKVLLKFPFTHFALQNSSHHPLNLFQKHHLDQYLLFEMNYHSNLQKPFQLYQINQIIRPTPKQLNILQNLWLTYC